MDNAKKLIEDLVGKGAKFSVYTDIMYGRGINGVDFYSYGQYEELGRDNNPTTKIYRTFEPEDDYLVIVEKVVYPKIPWNKAAEKDPVTRRKYIGYNRIAYISETV